MIVQFGPYPPPIGGISIYIKRFKEYLNIKGYDNIVVTPHGTGDYNNKEVLNIRLKLFPFFLLSEKGISILHYNITGVKPKILIGFFNKYLTSNKTKKILTIHGEVYNLFGKLTDKKLIRSLNTFDAIICVKKGNEKVLIERGYINMCYVIPAFIPPTEEETGIEQLSEYFHKIRKKHSFLITANAYKISFYKNEDLYGIDLSIELMKRLVQDGYIDIGFIYVIPDVGDYQYLEKMEKLIKLYKLENNFYFYTKPVSYPAVINICDLFIRPTNTDGYSISIAEAISLKKTAIASNVCKRPEGTILFKNRDIKDLYIKTKYCIEHYLECKKQLDNIEFENNAEKIIQVYENVMNEK